MFSQVVAVGTKLYQPYYVSVKIASGSLGEEFADDLNHLMPLVVLRPNVFIPHRRLNCCCSISSSSAVVRRGGEGQKAAAVAAESVTEKPPSPLAPP